MKPKKLPRTAVSITKRDCFVTSIHSQTGQEVAEGTLSAGSLARNVLTESTPDGQVTTFEASTDNGKHWYRTETFEQVKNLFETARPFTVMRNRSSTVIGHYLSAGSLARNVLTESTPDGQVTTFEASTDNGKHWYRTETFEQVKNLFETARPFTVMRNRSS